MGRKAVSPAFKRARQFCAMFTNSEAARIEWAVRQGHFGTPSDLMRVAIDKLLDELKIDVGEAEEGMRREREQSGGQG